MQLVIVTVTVCTSFEVSEEDGKTEIEIHDIGSTEHFVLGVETSLERAKEMFRKWWNAQVVTDNDVLEESPVQSVNFNMTFLGVAQATPNLVLDPGDV